MKNESSVLRQDLAGSAVPLFAVHIFLLLETCRIEISGDVTGRSLRSATLYMVDTLNLSGILNVISSRSVIIEITGENADTERFIEWIYEWLEPDHGLTIFITRPELKLFRDFVIMTEKTTASRPGTSCSFRCMSASFGRIVKSLFQHHHS